MNRKIILAAAVVIAVAALFYIVPRPTRQTGGTAPPAESKIDLAKGRALFEKNCMACHGPGAKGSGNGPTENGL